MSQTIVNESTENQIEEIETLLFNDDSSNKLDKQKMIDRKTKDLIEHLDPNQLMELNVDWLMIKIAIFFDDKLNQHEKALEYFLKSLEMRKMMFDDRDHLKIAQSLHSIGLMYGKMKQQEKSLEFKLKSCEMKKRLLFGDQKRDHEEIVKSLVSVGFSYSKLDQHERSLEFRLEAHEMLKRLLGDDKDHEEIVKSLNNIAFCYQKLKRFEKALEYDLKAFEMSKRLLKYDDKDSNHSGIFSSLDGIILSYYRLDDKKNADKYENILDLFQFFIQNNKKKTPQKKS